MTFLDEGLLISCVVLIGHHNITHGGESQLGNLKTPIGNYDEDLFQSRVMDKNLILNHHLTQQYILVIGR